jgi:hypothetical protein
LVAEVAVMTNEAEFILANVLPFVYRLDEAGPLNVIVLPDPVAVTPLSKSKKLTG